MPQIRVTNAGAVGVLKDLSVAELPVGAWTDAQDMRFLDGYALQAYGHGSVYGTPSVTPYHVLPLNIGSSRYWMYAGAAKVYAVNITGGAAVHTNITRQTAGVDVNYTGAANAWTSTSLSGIPILNAGNTVDVPQQWDTNIANRMTALSNWPASTYCKSIRSYNQILVAMGITEGGVYKPYLVMFSNAADPGAVPTTWDHTDSTKDAGRFDISQGGDYIIDGLQLRNSFIVYKEQSVWRLDYVGGTFILNSQKVLGMSGALNRNCITEMDGWHFVLTGSDVVVHDGQSATSVLDEVARRALFQDIDVDYQSLSFVFKNPFLNEVYVCYASIGNTVPNKALVWNYKKRTVSYRSLPNLYHANYGPVDNTLAGTWAADSDPWGSDLTVWNGGDYTPNLTRVLMASSQTKLFMLDSAASFDGALPNAYLERIGLTFDDPEAIKLVTRIRPRITGNTGDTVTVKIGSSADPYAVPTYTSMTYTIGATVACDCFVSGRYISVRFETATAYNWRLDGYVIDYEIQGEW